MSFPTEAVGFMAEDFSLNFKKKPVPLKKSGDFDVDIRIEACGICGTDVHQLSGGWGPQPLPLCGGHEIAGVVTRCGPKVTLISPGQRVGVGAQVNSCGNCKQCKDGHEQYCNIDLMHTAGSVWVDSGIVSHGGFASSIRVPEQFVYPIPDGLSFRDAAPMFCAGITAYSPLANFGIKGKKIGIIGLGAIGHFAVLWSKALEAESIWVISRTTAKQADAQKLGADGFIATSNSTNWEQPHKNSFDILLNCASASLGELEVDKYISLLDVYGRFISVGIPGQKPETKGTENASEESSSPPPEPPSLKLNIMTLITNGALVGMSHIGNRTQIIEMLQLAARKNIKPWIEEIHIDADGLKKGMMKMEDSRVRYKICMVGHTKEFNRREETSNQ